MLYLLFFYWFINLFTYFFIFLLILHFFIFLGIQLRNDQDYFITLFQFFIYQFFWCILSYQVQSYEAIIQKKLSTTASVDTSFTAVTGSDCTDWDLNVAFSEWHFTLMDSTALLQVVLHLTQPECIALDIGLQIEIHCTVLQWVGLDWTGLDWTEQDSTSRNWIVAVVFYGLGVFRMEIHRNVLAQMGLDWSERDKTVLYWTTEH